MVSGIGSVSLKTMRPYITVNGIPCTNSMILKHVTEAACDLRCADGWYGSPSSYECSNFDIHFHDMNIPAMTTIQCVEALCDEFHFDEGRMIGGGARPCDSTTRLGTQNNTFCTVECIEGYSPQGSGIVSCPSDASENQMPDVDLVCTEVSCSALDLSNVVAGVVPGDNDPCSITSPYTVLSTITNPICFVREFKVHHSLSLSLSHTRVCI